LSTIFSVVAEDFGIDKEHWAFLTRFALICDSSRIR
jgi:hypothetical protein